MIISGLTGCFCRGVAMMACLAMATSAGAETMPGDARTRMVAVARASRLVEAAVGDSLAAARSIRDRPLRNATLAILAEPDRCIRHRLAIDAGRRSAVIERLAAIGLLDRRLPHETLMAGVFPPGAPGDGCVRLGFAALLAPGGDGVSHHSWPGGLALHVASNLTLARHLEAAHAAGPGRVRGDDDGLIAGILWHDWAKALTLQWRGDGDLTPELRIAGTGAHHILGLAEAMASGLLPAQIVVQACAHGTDPADLTRWLTAAAIIAGRDPGAFPVVVTSACLVNHLADQQWEWEDAAVAAADQALARLAPTLGVDPARHAAYRLDFRNVALAEYGAAWFYTRDDATIRRELHRRRWTQSIR